MKRVSKVLILAAAIALAATAARAQAYIGGSVGHSAMSPTVAEDSINQWNAVMYGPGNDCETLNCYSQEEASGALKFFGGYRFNPYVAAEGFLAYLGTFDSYAYDGISVDATGTADVGTLGVAAVGMIPIGNRVSLLGKLGAHSWSADGDIVLWDVDKAAGLAGSYEESGTDFMGGVGVEIYFGDHAAMRVEFEYFEANTEYSEFGVGFLSVGGMFRF